MSSLNPIAFKHPLRSARRATDRDDEAIAAERKEAIERSRQEGIALGRVEGEKSVEKERAILSKIIAALSSQEEQLYSEMQDVIPELVIAAVERVIGDWEPDTEKVESIVRSILERVGSGQSNLQIYLCARDLSIVESIGSFLKESYPELSFIEDAELRSGECYVRSRFGMTDGTFRAKLENLKNVMR